jgi:GT2 family glycosyltransferase
VSGAGISVAVVTCGRPASLARCLHALARGTTPPGEMIIVDQVPSPITRRIVEQCGIEGARHLEQARLGTSAARNLALAVASGDLFAVIDDDCTPDPEWVTALAAALERPPTPVVVTGAVLPLGPRPPGMHPVSLRTDAHATDCSGRMRPWMHGGGCNFAARRDVLCELHGWDERLGPGSPGKAFEDAELLYRILREGGIVRYEPAAAVRHEWTTWARRLATRSTYGYGMGAMCGLWLRRGDVLALRLFAAQAKDLLKALARTALRRERAAVAEHSRMIAALLPGLMYGLSLNGATSGRAFQAIEGP